MHEHGGAGRVGGLGRVLAAAACLAVGPLAAGDDFVEQVNARFRSVSAEQRSDLVLLPALAAMQPPPGLLEGGATALNLLPGMSGWAEAEAWAAGEPQRAALEALARVTEDADYHVAMAFAQPYGVEGIPVETVRAGLYTELGDPPTLAAAAFGHLRALERLRVLVQVEASRRVGAGKPAEAIELLIDWLFLARQIADRAFFEEVDWALGAIAQGQERIRDVAYLDSRGAKALTADQLRDFIARLDEDKGYLSLTRLGFPGGDRAGVEQVVARVMEPRGGINEATFAPTMASLGSTDRPLRLFGEAGRWKAAGAMHLNWFDTTAEVPKVFDDWSSRWRLDTFDPRMAQPFHFTRLNRGGFAVIAATTPDMGGLFDRRLVARTEGVGTRAALALVGYAAANGVFPPTVSSIRPRFVAEMEADPFNPNLARGARPPLEFFVPIRDQQFGPREEPHPHEVNVIMPGGANFSVNLGQDTFVLYSLGSDNARNWATKVQNTPVKVLGADYLIWPPTLSLHRQHLIDAEQLK